MKLLEKLIKAFFNIITIIIIILIIIAIYCIYQTHFLKVKYASVFNYTFFEIRTGSMSGTIEIDDIIIVKITKDVHNGEIITYIDSNDAIITHRIIEEQEDILVTQGDANNAKDKPISRDQVIGKVVKVFSGFSVWMKVFSNWKVIVCIVVTLFFLGLAITGDKKKEEKKRKHSITIAIRKIIEHRKKDRE